MKLTTQEPGMVFSIALHAGLIAFAIVGLSGPKPFDEFAEAVPVDVISDRQYNELVKGDLKEKQVRPETPLRVDRVAKVEEQKEPATAKTDAPAPPPPPLRPEVKQAPEDVDEERPVPPPPPKVAIVPPPRPEPVKPEPVKPPPPVKAVPKAAPEPDEEIDRQAEIIRQQKLKAEKERQQAEEARKAEAARKLAQQQAQQQAEAKAKAEAEARAKAEAAKAAEARREIEDARKAEEAAKAAEAKRIADENNRKAAEAARKAAEAKKALEARKAAEKAESDKLQAAIRSKLLASRDAPASSGSTGERVTRSASAGVANATGQRLSPSDRSYLMGLIKEQMERCWSVTGMSNPAVKPLVRLQLTQAGSIAVQPTLVNNSGDPAFRAIAESGMRAIRACAPYRIPAKFSDSFQDWKTITVKLDPSDLL